MKFNSRDERLSNKFSDCCGKIRSGHHTQRYKLSRDRIKAKKDLAQDFNNSRLRKFDLKLMKDVFMYKFAER